jgi:hypothetical protein
MKKRKTEASGGWGRQPRNRKKKRKKKKSGGSGGRQPPGLRHRNTHSNLKQNYLKSYFL